MDKATVAAIISFAVHIWKWSQLLGTNLGTEWSWGPILGQNYTWTIMNCLDRPQKTENDRTLTETYEKASKNDQTLNKTRL